MPRAVTSISAQLLCSEVYTRGTGHPFIKSHLDSFVESEQTLAPEKSRGRRNAS